MRKRRRMPKEILAPANDSPHMPANYYKFEYSLPQKKGERIKCNPKFHDLKGTSFVTTSIHIECYGIKARKNAWNLRCKGRKMFAYYSFLRNSVIEILPSPFLFTPNSKLSLDLVPERKMVYPCGEKITVMLCGYGMPGEEK